MSQIASFSANGQTLPWGGYFHSFEMLKGMTDHPDRAVWSFLGLPREAIAKAALAINQNLQFRWGQGNNLSIPHNYVIHSIDLKYIGDQAFCKLHLMDCRLHMMANSAFSSYPHQSFSQIVSSIVGSYSGFPAAVVKADKYISDILQTGANHWAFLSALKREGCKAADNGDSDYRLFFKGGNELHFHPPDYSQSPARQITVLGGSTIPQMDMRANPWKPIVKGSVGYRLTQFLKNEVKPYTSSSSQADAFSGELALGTKAGGAQPIPSSYAGAFLGRFRHTNHDTAPLIEKDANVGAEAAIYDANHMELAMVGDAALDQGQIIQINHIDPATGQPFEAHGQWLIEQIHHHIGEGETLGRTKLALSRTASSEIGQDQIQGLTSSTSGRGGNSQYGGTNSGGGTVRSAAGIT